MADTILDRLLLQPGRAQTPQAPAVCSNKTKVSFVNNNSSAAQQIADKLNTSPTFILAQSGLESAFGNSPVAIQANNYFGLTVGPAFKGTVGTYTASTGYKFRVYPAPGFLNSGDVLRQ